MTTLTVWKFDDPAGAGDALDALESLQKQELIQILDGAVVSWAAGKRKPRTHHLHHAAVGGALGGGFWGLLFGVVFFAPFLGAAVGVGIGSVMGAMSKVGIDGGFVDEVRAQVTPGTSALFLMSDAAVIDKVEDAFRGAHPKLIRTNLSDAQAAKLRDVFAED